MWQLQGITVNLKRNRKGFKPEECTSLHDCFTNTSSDSLRRGATLHTSYGCKAIETWCPKSYLNWNWHRHADTLLVVFGDKELGRACYLSPVFTCRTCLMLATSCIFFFFFLVSQVLVWEEWYICIVFREEEHKSLFLTARFLGLLKGFKVTAVKNHENKPVNLKFDCRQLNCSHDSGEMICMCTIMWPVF